MVKLTDSYELSKNVIMRADCLETRLIKKCDFNMMKIILQLQT